MIANTPDQYTAFMHSGITDDCGDLQDNRFAVVAGSLYEVVSYTGCVDGSRYDTLTVQACDDTYNPLHGQQLTSCYVENAPTQAYVFKDTPGAANALFVSLITAALTAFN